MSAESGAPAVSVVICTFRRPEFLNQALASVYDQTFKDFEVIVADDGSGDQITRQYELREGTQLVCSPESGRGSAATRNMGTRLAKGRFIAYLDDDDVWLPNKLETQMRILKDNPGVGLTYCHHTLVDRDQVPLHNQPDPKTNQGECCVRLVTGNFIKSPSCVLMRRDVLDTCGLYNETVKKAEDWEFWVRVAHAYKIHCDQESRVLYRVHPTQKTASTLVARRGQVFVMETLCRWAESNAPDILPHIRRGLSYRLQRLSKWEAKEGSASVAVRCLTRAIRLSPFDVRCYGRFVQIGISALKQGKK